MLYRLSWIRTRISVGTDCIGSCKSNYHTITTMMAPFMMSSDPVPTFILPTCNSKSKISSNLYKLLFYLIYCPSTIHHSRSLQLLMRRLLSRIVQRQNLYREVKDLKYSMTRKMVNFLCVCRQVFFK